VIKYAFDKSIDSHSFSLSGEFRELSSDEPLSNLFGATTDIEKFSVAHEPSNGVIVDITISSK
jgi:hypothetical protein